MGTGPSPHISFMQEHKPVPLLSPGEAWEPQPPPGPVLTSLKQQIFLRHLWSAKKVHVPSSEEQGHSASQEIGAGARVPGRTAPSASSLLRPASPSKARLLSPCDKLTFRAARLRPAWGGSAPARQGPRRASARALACNRD